MDLLLNYTPLSKDVSGIINNYYDNSYNTLVKIFEKTTTSNSKVLFYIKKDIKLIDIMSMSILDGYVGFSYYPEPYMNKFISDQITNDLVIRNLYDNRCKDYHYIKLRNMSGKIKNMLLLDIYDKIVTKN
jgi:hypothetical protein